MVDEDLGEATLVYEGPDGDTIERTVDNEHVAYVQDHWIVKTDETAAERDTIRRIPAQRVYYVERDVEAFEEEVSTLLDEVQSVADGVGEGVETLRSRVEAVASDVPRGILGRRERREHASDEEPIRIDVGGAGDPDGDEADREPGRTAGESDGHDESDERYSDGEAPGSVGGGDGGDEPSA